MVVFLIETESRQKGENENRMGVGQSRRTESGQSTGTKRSRPWLGKQGNQSVAYKSIEKVVISGHQHCLSKNK